jgi:hypothetical protein
MIYSVRWQHTAWAWYNSMLSLLINFSIIWLKINYCMCHFLLHIFNSHGRFYGVPNLLKSNYSTKRDLSYKRVWLICDLRGGWIDSNLTWEDVFVHARCQKRYQKLVSPVFVNKVESLWTRWRKGRSDAGVGSQIQTQALSSHSHRCKDLANAIPDSLQKFSSVTTPPYLSSIAITSGISLLCFRWWHDPLCRSCNPIN